VKFLADMGVSMTTVDLLRQAGETVVHLRDEGLHRYRLRRLPIQ
jgi:predicted nuclease of predicted toxin-antitoxin system